MNLLVYDNVAFKLQEKTNHSPAAQALGEKLTTVCGALVEIDVLVRFSCSDNLRMTSKMNWDAIRFFHVFQPVFLSQYPERHRLNALLYASLTKNECLPYFSSTPVYPVLVYLTITYYIPVWCIPILTLLTLHFLTLLTIPHVALQ